ncbi:MAG: hypothetical protein RLZZ490_748 [Cyanobacteriota bacterium]|jgi:hypothetical protein
MDFSQYSTLVNANLINDGISIFLGIALSAACGFRVFVPFLMLSLVGVMNWWSLPPGFEWLDSPEALIVLAVASSLEVIAYGIPWLDNLLDVIATPLATLAGVLATVTVLPADMTPLVQWTLAVIAGGGSAGLVKGFTNISRLTSTATTGGLGNFIVASLELMVAILLPLLALSLPVIAGLVVCVILFAGLGFVAIQVWQKRAKTKEVS